jgi:hypothetical protein
MNRPDPKSMPSRGLWPTAVAALVAVCATFALLLPGTVRAADPVAWERASASFSAAVAGDSHAVEATAAQWRALSDADPADAVARAYAGAATSMLANTTILPWRKLAHVDAGLAMLDQALAQAAAEPERKTASGVAAGLEVRFVAANTFLALPSMFNRGPRGAKLLDEVARSAQLAGAPARFQAAVWLRAGDLASAEKRSDDARRWYERAAASGAPQAAAAQARLKAL